MHIGFCGPITLSLLADLLDRPVSIKGYPFRGSATLVREYLSFGHEVTVFTTSPDIDSVTTYAGPHLKVVVVPTRSRGYQRAFDFFGQERAKLIEVIRREQPDVLHANWTYEFGLAARGSGIPALVTVHDWAPRVARNNKHPYWYFRLLMQIRCLSLAGPLTAPSEYLAHRVRVIYRRSCVVIPNGIDMSSFKTASRRPSGDGMRVGMLNVGFSSLKNVQGALRAWAAVHRFWPGATLVAAGPGYEPQGEAQRWAAANSLDSQVEFVGPVGPEHVPTFFSSLDVFLHPSKEESFGMVLVEAMASGVPVIAGQNSGAVPEITGGRALLTDVHSVGAIASALQSILSDEALRNSLASEGLVWSLGYDLTNTAQLYVEQLIALVDH